jgi:hypothetical protein
VILKIFSQKNGEELAFLAQNTACLFKKPDHSIGLFGKNGENWRKSLKIVIPEKSIFVWSAESQVFAFYTKA